MLPPGGDGSSYILQRKQSSSNGDVPCTVTLTRETSISELSAFTDKDESSREGTTGN